MFNIGFTSKVNVFAGLHSLLEILVEEKSASASVGLFGVGSLWFVGLSSYFLAVVSLGLCS